MKPRLLAVLTVLAAAASVALLWTEAVPLGVPGEWTWGRLSYTVPSFLWAVMVCGMTGCGYLAFVWWGDRCHTAASAGEEPAETASPHGTSEGESSRKVTTALTLAGLVVAGFVWLCAVQSVAIEGLGLGKAPYVLYYRRTEGYFWQARYDIRSIPEFLVGYEDLLAERDYLHLGTHPPGLALAHYGLIELCRSSPRLVSWVVWSEPRVVRETLTGMQSLARGSGHEITDTDAAALWLAALLTQFAAALTVVPLYLYIRLRASPVAAWRAAVLWPLVPAVAVFLPKSDVLYPLLAMTAAWQWRLACLRAQQRIGPTSLVCWLLGSLALWTGMLLSLAFLTVGALLAVQMVCDMAEEYVAVQDPALPRPGLGPRVSVGLHQATVVVCSAGCALLTLGLLLTWCGSHGMNLLSVWQWNLSNHALFYEHNVRTWWKWLLVNPLEVTLAAGVPVAALAKWGGIDGLRDPRRLLCSPIVPFTVVWTLLWLSGKNMGEAARLWIILLPWLVAGTAAAWERRPAAVAARVGVSRTEREEAATTRGRWLAAVLLQLVASALTVLRVDGFHFTELLRP